MRDFDYAKKSSNFCYLIPKSYPNLFIFLICRVFLKSASYLTPSVGIFLSFKIAGPGPLIHTKRLNISTLFDFLVIITPMTFFR